MIGIIKNNKHSFKDFGLTINSKSIGIPKKNKIKETVPFMNGSYDFSLIYGDQTYEERQLEYTFNLNSKNKIEMNIVKIKVIDWLMEGIKSPLYDDSIPGYYFLCECEETSFDESGKGGLLKVTFTAYPFKIATREEGNDIWDEFNFELDYAQYLKFDIKNSLTTNIINPSAISITPDVVCSNKIEVIKDNITYIFNPGTTKDFRFKLVKGNNNITIKGTGTIEFKFRKEIL